MGTYDVSHDVRPFFLWQHPDFYKLTELMKKVSLEVVQGGGLVRGIHNHGIRELVRFVFWLVGVIVWLT